MKILLVLIYLFSFSHFVFSSDIKYSKSSEFKITYPIVSTDKIIINNISINNSAKKYRFLLDTGSSRTTISEAIADELNIKFLGKEEIHDGIKTYNLNYSNIDVKISNVSFANCKVDIMDLKKINEVFCDIDGIIGINLLKKCVCKLSSKSITLTNSIKNLNKSNYEKLAFHLSSVPIIAGVKLRNNIQNNMLLDLGDNTLVAFNEKSTPFIRKKKLLKGYGNYYSTAFGEVKKDSFLIIKPVEPLLLGKTKLENVTTDVNYDNDSYYGVIGSQILEYYDLIIDFPKEKLYIKQKNSKYNTTKDESYGFKYSINNNKVKVSFIWDKSSAFDNGLMCDQQIEKINGMSLVNIDKQACQLRLEIDSILNSNNSIHLKIVGNSSEFILQKINLFEKH